MRNKLMTLAILWTLVIMPVFSFAASDTTDDFTPRSKKIFLEPEKSVVEKGKLKFLLAGTAGYDNNATLNSNKDRDAFIQSFLKASFISPLSEKVDLKIDYEMMNLLYGSEGDLDLTRNGMRLGLDHKLSEDLVLSTSYSLDSVQFLNTRDDYLDNSVELKLMQKLPNRMFHSVAYDVMFRNYQDRVIRTSAGLESDKKRNDWRNTVTYEVGKYFKKDLFKLTLGYFSNNANDPYLKYYDYDWYKVGGSVTHLFNNKWSGLLAYSKYYRDYRGRTLINDANVKEFEKSDLITTALFYSINKSLSFGLNYTYRRNSSNEPIDKYAGSIFSLSSYYKF